MRYGKYIYFTRVVVTLALLGHQTSHSQNKFFFPLLHNVLFIEGTIQGGKDYFQLKNSKQKNNVFNKLYIYLYIASHSIFKSGTILINDGSIFWEKDSLQIYCSQLPEINSPMPEIIKKQFFETTFLRTN